jgi:mRNA interferase RelE/StbE
LYRIEYGRAALREIDRLPLPIKARIIAAIEALAVDPRPAGTRKMVGTANGYRIRVGDYRVLYEIEDDRLLIAVIKVARRDQAYRRA